MDASEIQKLLREGIAAAKAAQQQPAQGQPGQRPIRRLSSTRNAQKERARQLLLQVTELDDTNIQAWLWLSTVTDDLSEQRLYLSNALLLDPHHKAARVGLAQVDKQMSAAGAKVGLEKSSPPLKTTGPDKQPAPLQQTGAQPGCPFCGQPIGSMDMTCPHCHFPLVMDCPKCNTLMDVEWQHCQNCHFEMGDYRLGPVYFTQLAIAYQKYHRASKAAQALAIVEKMEPDQPDLYRQIGQVQADLGHTGAAIASLERAIALEPEQAGPYLALGKVLQQEGHWHQAEKIYRQAIATIPQSSETYFALGDLFLQRNRLKQAQKYLQKTIAMDPQHGIAWARMGQIHESQKRRSVAIRAYRRAEPLLEPESFDGKQVRERLAILQPKLPVQLGRSWVEFVRQISGPILICMVALLLDSGLRPWWIPWTGWVALGLALLGAPLWVSGYFLPQNPLICSVGGPCGLGKFKRLVVAFLGAFSWLLAMAIILMPIGQSYPESPL